MIDVFGLFLPFALGFTAQGTATQASSDDVGQTLVVAPRSAGTATSTKTGRVVLDAQDLERTGERSLPRAIGRASGVWIQETNLGGGSAFIRGLTGNQVLILVDGVRLNDATTRFGPNQSLNTIDPGIVDRVEVLRGPASVLYGSDAIGGVILIWTKRSIPVGQGGAEGFRGTLDVEARSSSEGYRASPGAGGADETFGWWLQGGIQEWDDLRAADNTEIPFTGYNGHALFGSAEWGPNEHENWRFTARVNRDFDVPRTDRLIVGFGQTNPAADRYLFALQDRRAYGLTYTNTEANSLADRMQVRVSVREYEEERERVNFGSSTLRLERDEVDTVGLGVDWQKAVGDDHLLTYGIDLENDKVDSVRRDRDIPSGATTVREGQFAPDARYTRFGLFLQDEIFAFEDYDVTAGIRYSHYDFAFQNFASQGGGRESGDFGAVTASLQASRELSDGFRVTGTLASGFRAPNLDDLAKDGSFGGGMELHNADLDPEQSLTQELTFEYTRPRWNIAVSFFHTGISDVVGRRLVSVGDPTMTGDETYLRDNVGSATLFGGEVLLKQQLGSAPNSPLFLDIALAFVHGQQFDRTEDPVGSGQFPLNDVPVRRIPPLHGRVGLTYETGQVFEKYFDWARAEVVFANNQDRLHPGDISDPRIDPNGSDSWSVLNLDVGGPIGKQGSGSRWSAGVHNVLDERYRVHGSGFDASGVNAVFGLHLSF